MAKSRFPKRTKSLPTVNLCTAEPLASCFLANLSTSGTQAKSCGSPYYKCQLEYCTCRITVPCKWLAKGGYKPFTRLSLLGSLANHGISSLNGIFLQVLEHWQAKRTCSKLWTSPWQRPTENQTPKRSQNREPVIFTPRKILEIVPNLRLATFISSHRPCQCKILRASEVVMYPKEIRNAVPAP